MAGGGSARGGLRSRHRPRELPQPNPPRFLAAGSHATLPPGSHPGALRRSLSELRNDADRVDSLDLRSLDGAPLQHTLGVAARELGHLAIEFTYDVAQTISIGILQA